MTHLEAPTSSPTLRRERGFDVLGAMWTLIRTDFMVRYHGTAMGFLWALLRPLAMLTVLLAVFSLVFRSTEHYAIYLVVGLFIYDFFQEATKVGLVSLHAKGYLLNKSRFPRYLFVIASTVNPLVTLLVAHAGIVAALAFSGHAPSTGRLLLLFVYLLHLVVVVVGFSLATSVLFLRYRDLNQVWEVISHAGFFVAPVIYPLGIIPEQYHAYLYLWAPTSVIEFSRAALTGGVLPTAKAHALLALMAAACLVCGLLLYRRLAPRAAEYL